jgi:phage-related tail fiber protein
MPENGLTPAAKRRQEFVDAEAALRARPRSTEEIAGDLTPAEEAEIIAQDERLVAASAATQAAQQALTAARAPVWTRGDGAVVAARQARQAQQARAAAATAEETALVERVRLHERIGASRQARRQEAAR